MDLNQFRGSVRQPSRLPESLQISRPEPGAHLPGLRTPSALRKRDLMAVVLAFALALGLLAIGKPNPPGPDAMELPWGMGP